MLEVGKKYELVTLVVGDNGYDQMTQWVTITQVDGNLVEIDGHTVLNLASPMFHSAKDQEAEKEHNRKAAEDFEINIIYEDAPKS